ncbi:MAG: bifunctional ADP-dependent NAD(P)H-hydrate dehydratase/NAD(P)H-hydrate epimerase [Thermoplasmata archaeon]|nr:MAG: bifunctional ADP-dependent NAD(P)H-hydrate dehydratase/NAD(P)H-hydrate epimerase [Thermoplasmata archaeon]
MINWEEIHVLDKNAEFYGVPTTKLMENAGKHVAKFISDQLRIVTKNILVLSGVGNNGGDGFVAARYLSKKYNVTVFLTGKEQDIKTEISKNNFKKLKEKNITIYDIRSLKKLDTLLQENQVIIDAMLGIGLSGTLKEPYSEIVKKVNKTKNKTIISVDTPTGLGTNNTVKPQYTITFHDIKKGMTPKNSGEIIIADIGIPKKAIEYVGPGELSTYYPKPKKTSHKGDNGKLLVIGGGPYIGAPALSGLAALRTGIDLVFIAAPKRVAKAITSFSPFIQPKKLAIGIAKLSPNLIVTELKHDEILTPEDIGLIEKILSKVDAVVIGPGLGSENITKKAIEKIINRCVKNLKPMVIDADAIQVVGEKTELIKNTSTVITPHAGEFKELTGVKLPSETEGRKKTVEKYAKKIGVTILLKGSVDIISNGKETKLNDIHNPGMTVGGTGDVLAGITGALLSKKVGPYNAARISVFINGTAGNNAFKKRSYGLIATDIIDEISNVLKKYL